MLIQINGVAAASGYAEAISRVPGGIKPVDQVDLEYYRARIAAEELAAQRATHPLAAESHRRLAEEYASLILACEVAPPVCVD